jgi:membrane-bound metal-dependent hydrolase YbcI (DUF457 family)
MAGFKTHLTVSTLAGLAYGAAANAIYDVPLPTCVLAGGLCSVSGMLPDIDSGPGRPLKESLAFAAAVVSTMLVDRLERFELSMESIILASAAIYLLIRFGLAKLLQLYTVHRGMFHSLPAAVVFGEVAFLLSSGEPAIRWYKAGAVVAGYLSHLALDEFYSVGYVRGRMAFKRSFGTAVKLYGHGWLANLSVYAQLALLTFLVLKEPTWMEQQHQRYRERLDQATANLMEMFHNDSQPTVAQQSARPEASDDASIRPNRGDPVPLPAVKGREGEPIRQAAGYPGPASPARH